MGGRVVKSGRVGQVHGERGNVLIMVLDTGYWVLDTGVPVLAGRKSPWVAAA